MTRILIAAKDNHHIIDGGLIGAAAALFKRIADPIVSVDDGISHGLNIEDTEFSFSPFWGGLIGEPGTPHDEWRHPVTNEPMTVFPRFWIIEALIVPPGDPAFADLFDPEISVTTPTMGPDAGIEIFTVIQQRKNELTRSGTAPNTLTPVELVELEATHRLRLNRGRALNVFNLRPTPPSTESRSRSERVQA